MKFKGWLVIPLVLVSNASARSVSKTADTIFFNGSIYTMATQQSQVNALAIRGQKIISVGSVDRVFAHRGRLTKMIDLQGKTVLPGFIESHAHLTVLGSVLQRLKISGLKSEAELAALVAARVKELKPGEWLISQGWDQTEWGRKDFPTHQMISAAAPNNPVLLKRVDGHTALVNQKAMDLAGIDRNTPDPTGGKIIRDNKGNATGILLDQAQQYVARIIPEPTSVQIKKWIEITMHESLKNGITSFADMSTAKETFLVLKEMATNKQLNMRVYAVHGDASPEMLPRKGKWTEEVLKNQLPMIGFGDGYLTARAIKIIADGSLGGRGAALLKPYSDQPDTSGFLRKTESEVLALTSLALKKGYQVATHAIGDYANQVVLNAYERALRENPAVKSPRLRIEHVQVITRDDVARLNRFKVIASMQPNHCTTDIAWIEDRLGVDRAGDEAFIWRSISSSGTLLAFGSDAPYGMLSPLVNIYSAITRLNDEGIPPGGWHPEQRLTLLESLKAYTSSAAFAAFEERKKGSLEVGKLADIVVFSQDIFKLTPAEIKNLPVDMTMVGGRTVYEREGSKLAEL